ncbi:MAG: nucleoid-associated protein [Gemmiger sp.]|uniref:nucleoid-associated protein n=1 Tax=Gemmiger sp. TaxID=2049027 RepID=UPI002E79E18F|nr:nucleoid-associated protein [Gemmiger sp.]MEE0799853.1 nucleoid-associated protein [Gemmiger sp.]
MDVKLNQVIFHLLDSGASEPVLSDRPMDLDADLYDYFTACIEKAFASDDGKNCRFLPDSPFLAEMQHNEDFIDLSRRIAGVIFDQLLQYPGIPSGDLAVADCTADGVPYYAVLKLNYRPGFTHTTNVLGNGRCSTLAPQRTLLPGTPRADEAALIDRANLTVRLIEKKFPMDDKKDFYLSTRVFSCAQALPEKAKLKAVCETAVAAVQQAYPEPEALDDVPPFDGGTETAVELLVRNQAVDNTIAVEDVRTRMQEQYPLAVPAFEQALAESGVDTTDRVTVSPARIKKLESRSFKTESGIEIKIPAELCNSDDAVEFIHSATGGLSLLIKDVLV